MQQHFGGMQRNKEKGMGNGRGKKKVLEKLNGLGLQTNSLILFLKAAVMKMKAMLIST